MRKQMGMETLLESLRLLPKLHSSSQALISSDKSLDEGTCGQNKTNFRKHIKCIFNPISATHSYRETTWYVQPIHNAKADDRVPAAPVPVSQLIASLCIFDLRRHEDYELSFKT